MGQKKETFFMSYLNSVTIVGFVGADPERRRARNNGSQFTVLSVATQHSWKNAEDEWVSKVEWHRVAIFRPLSVSLASSESLGLGGRFLHPLHGTTKASAKSGIRLPVAEELSDSGRFEKVFYNSVHKAVCLLLVTRFVQLSEHCLQVSQVFPGDI
jgi:hypothetical protein